MNIKQKKAKFKLKIWDSFGQPIGKLKGDLKGIKKYFEELEVKFK